jgi:hypothetical protein
MIIVSWMDLLLTLGSVMFAAVLCLFPLVAHRWVRAARGDASDKQMTAIPNDDIDAVEWASDVLSQTNERFFQAFKAMSDEDRLSRKGVQLAYLCDLFWKAADYVEDAREITRGNKIATLADPIAERATLELIEMMQSLDLPLVAGPMAGYKPTHH